MNTPRETLEITEEIAMDAAQFSSFAQRVKMAYWKEWETRRLSEPSGNLCREKELDRILIHAFDEAKAFLQSLATKHDDEIKELREAVAKELKKFTDDEMSIHEPSGIIATQMRTVNVFSDSTLQAFDSCRNIQLTRKDK